MNISFRPRRSVQLQGIVFTLLFLAAAAANVSVLFMKDPAQAGFKGEHSVLIVVGMGLILYGGMTLVGAYVLASYYLERVTIDGTIVLVKSVFRRRQFDATTIDRLSWKAIRRLDCWVSKRRIAIDLGSLGDEDRLRIIRIFRNLVPESKQEHWPTFCDKVAIPLRRRLAITSVEDAARGLAPGEIVITRRRYDRLAAILLPASGILALAYWWITARPALFALPVFVAFFWFMLRFSTRSQGERHMQISAQPIGRDLCFGLAAFGAAGILMPVLGLAGASRDVSGYAGVAAISIAFVVFLGIVHRADKRKKRDDAIAAKTAPERWDQGDADCLQTHTGQ